MPKASQLSCNFHITLLHILWSSSTTNTLHTKSNDTNEHPSVSNPTLHHEQHAGQALLDITARKRFYRRSQENSALSNAQSI